MCQSLLNFVYVELPIYELTISEDEQTGVDYVALVDHPAIERNWMAFNKDYQFKIQDEEKRIVSGPLMVAGQPIVRVDGAGQKYYVVFTADTISKIVKRFFKNGFTANVNQMHNSRMVADKCYMIESFIIDTKRGIHTPDFFAELPNGSWFGSYQIDNQAIWDKVKKGEFKGFSVEGIFEEVAIMDLDEQVIEELKEALINNY